MDSDAGDLGIIAAASGVDGVSVHADIDGHVAIAAVTFWARSLIQ